ncbi:PIN domain-containing protein [Actinopolymorpha sp. NPDC004070]|uniref:PIN domain-containing protein n=1 Tax=Actinopolymorpha sp. NPDC004070 TaxID=3154548 RepID=UPI0033B6F9CD
MEARLLDVLTGRPGNFEILDPTPADRERAAELVGQLVAAPLGYVDATILAMAERLKIVDIATVDFKFLGMASRVSRLSPLRWVLQEN